MAALGIDNGNLFSPTHNTRAFTCSDALVTGVECAASDSVQGTASLTTAPTGGEEGTGGGFSEAASLDVEMGARYTYTIKNVQQEAGTAAGYSVRVYAHTNGGYGLSAPDPSLTGGVVPALKPMQTPDAPGVATVHLVPGSSTSLKVRWTDVTTDPTKATGLTFGDRASPVDGYVIEWSTDPTFPNLTETADSTDPTGDATHGGLITKSPAFFTPATGGRG